MKIAARLTNFKGCFGLIWHLTLPSPATLPEPALWARYEFLNEHTTKIHFRGDSCVNQCRNSYLAQSAGSGSVAGEGKVKCQISPKHPLKLVNLAAIFTGNSVYIRE